MAIQISDVPNLAITLLIVAVIFVATFLCLAGLKASTTDTSATAAIGNVSSGMMNIVGFLPTVGTIVGVALLVGVVYLGFMYARNKQGGGV
jgi:hypothetical protein